MPENFMSVAMLRNVCRQAPGDARVFVWNGQRREWDVAAASLARPFEGHVRLIGDGPLPYSAAELAEEEELDVLAETVPVARLEGDCWVECSAVWYEELDNAVFVQ